ncbi:hypothetical protein BSK49_28585 [Paenibacillus odorifer]|uniref:stalk domain-containing protein n=1 Tax=Paenibacillus odorifer TaxID=189426 RepID=UPI00096DE9BD|nr:hypothetical protein [Paenibacillus odorifer]OMD80041.1 hypothetical protein BSK49_28585 [Paenibacillus odorifer]
MQVKKSVFISSLVVCSLVFGVVGAGAANGITKIQAALNSNIKFKVDGNSWQPKDGNGKNLSALVYNGTTYLPLRSTAEALGVNLSLNSATQVISLDSGSANGIPYNDATTSVAAPSTSTSSTSSDIKVLSGTTSQMTSKLKEQAVILLKMYGDSLLSGDTSNYAAYLSKNVSTSRENSGTSLGDDYFIDNYSDLVTGTKKANSASTLKSFAKALQDVKLSDIEVGLISDKNEYFQRFSFSFQPKDFNALSTVNVYFSYDVETYNSSTYILSEAYVD